MPNRLFKNFAPRWIIFCCDIVLVTLSISVSFFLNNHLALHIPDIISFTPGIIANIVISSTCIFVFAIYKGIIRYSEIKDIVRIIKFSFLQFALWLVVFYTDKDRYFTKEISIPLLFINLFVVIFLLVVFRLLVKEIYFRAQARPNAEHRTLIFGAGMMGQITKKVLEQDAKINTTLVGYVDDSYYKIGKKIEGLPIYNAVGAEFAKLLKTKKITQLYIAIDKLSVERKIAITDLCAPLKIKIHVVPHANQWSRGLFQKNQVREMNIEELLQRDEIILPNNLSRRLIMKMQRYWLLVQQALLAAKFAAS